MKTTRYLILSVILCSIFLVTCDSSTPQPKPKPTAQNLTSDAQRINLQTITEGMAIKVQYPVVQGGEQSTRQAMNSTITDLLSRAIAMGKPMGTIQEAVQFFQGASEGYNEEAENPFPWSLQVASTQPYIAKQVISVSTVVRIDLDGNGGSDQRFIFNFDPATGLQLSIDQLLLDKEGFTKIAQKAFYEALNSQATQLVNTDEEVFRLPTNLIYQENGILMVYEEALVAAYEIEGGGLEFVIPFSELKGLVLGVE